MPEKSLKVKLLLSYKYIQRYESVMLSGTVKIPHPPNLQFPTNHTLPGNISYK